MAYELEIFFSDLTSEAKKKVLKFLKIKRSKELYLDVFPLFLIHKGS
jgi:hypothetical protein